MDEVLATVNFATEKATITVPPSVRVDQLIEVIERARYGAEVLAPAAGAAMAASSTFVVGNSVRLRRSGTPAAAIRGRLRPWHDGRRETRVLAGLSQESR